MREAIKANDVKKVEIKRVKRVKDGSEAAIGALDVIKVVEFINISVKIVDDVKNSFNRSFFLLFSLTIGALYIKVVRREDVTYREEEFKIEFNNSFYRGFRRRIDFSDRF